MKTIFSIIHNSLVNDGKRSYAMLDENGNYFNPKTNQPETIATNCWVTDRRKLLHFLKDGESYKFVDIDTKGNRKEKTLVKQGPKQRKPKPKLSPIYENGVAYGVAYETGFDNTIELCAITFTTEKFATEFANRQRSRYLNGMLHVVRLRLA